MPRGDEAKLAAWVAIIVIAAILFSLPGPNRPAPRAVHVQARVQRITTVVHAAGLSGTDIVIMVLAGLAVVCSVGIVATMRHGPR
jgi:hypothetical protein